MVRMSAQDRKELLDANVANLTTAGKIAQRFSGGRPPYSELLTPEDAVRLVSRRLGEIRLELQLAGESPDDASAKIAVCTVDLRTAKAFPLVHLGESDLLRELHAGKYILLGAFFGVIDRDPKAKGKSIVWMRPFLVTKQVIAWMEELRDKEGAA